MLSFELWQCLFVLHFWYRCRGSWSSTHPFFILSFTRYHTHKFSPVIPSISVIVWFSDISWKTEKIKKKREKLLWLQLLLNCVYFADNHKQFLQTFSTWHLFPKRNIRVFLTFIFFLLLLLHLILLWKAKHTGFFRFHFISHYFALNFTIFHLVFYWLNFWIFFILSFVLY